MPQLLSNCSLQVNNLTLSATNYGVLQIETKGPWTGTAEELLDMLREVIGEVQDAD